MADEVLQRDQNHITVLGAITDDSNQYITMLRVDPTTKRLLVSAVGSLANLVVGSSVITGGTNGYALYDDNGVIGEMPFPASGITVGTTTITSGTNGKILYDNNGVVGELTNNFEVTTNKATDFTTINNTLYPTVQAVNNQIITSVTGLLDYRGSYDASLNLFPATGGSGTAGAILKGDFWICSVAGTLGGTSVTPGDLIIALVDTPGQTASNWDLIQHDINGAYVTTDQTVGQTIGATGARLTKLWATDITCTNAITGSVTGNAGTATIVDDNSSNITVYPVWVTANTGGLPLKVSSTMMNFNPSTGNFAFVSFNANNYTLNVATVTVTSNAGTVAVNRGVSNFTNSSASAMTITMATSGAVDGQKSLVRIYDASAVAKGITWVNVENSATITAPATSAGITTIPLTVGFIFNGVTSKWTCVGIS